jgi:hypothetical protein
MPGAREMSNTHRYSSRPGPAGGAESIIPPLTESPEQMQEVTPPHPTVQIFRPAPHRRGIYSAGWWKYRPRPVGG